MAAVVVLLETDLNLTVGDAAAAAVLVKMMAAVVGVAVAGQFQRLTCAVVA